VEQGSIEGRLEASIKGIDGLSTGDAFSTHDRIGLEGH